MLDVRAARVDDVAVLGELWHAGWHDGHDGHVPDALSRVRTRESFDVRIAERIPDTLVVGRAGEIAGFVTVVGDELEQVYVARAHRGSDVAPRLLDEGLRVVAERGHARAWLAVAAGNARARRFYEREGWRDAGAFDYLAQGPDGQIASPCHRYERAAQTAPRSGPAPGATESSTST